MIVCSQEKFNKIRIIVGIVFFILFIFLKDDIVGANKVLVSYSDSYSFFTFSIIVILMVSITTILIRSLYLIILIAVPKKELVILNSNEINNNFTFNKSAISEIIISNDDFQIYLTLKLNDSSERRFVPVIYSYFITSLSNKAIKYFMDQSDRLFHDIPITFEKKFPKYKNK